MSLIEHFEDLSSSMQEKLLNFIKSSYSKRSAFNYSVSAYGPVSYTHLVLPLVRETSD